MSILRNNWWNRTFHCKRLLQQQNEKFRLQNVVHLAPVFIKSLRKADSLTAVMNIHKVMWGCGLQNDAVGPNEYGMFRTSDILQMKPEEVLLGNIYGLWTRSLADWERRPKDEPYGEGWPGLPQGITVYEIILNQYREHLISNTWAMDKAAKARLAVLEKA